MTKLSTSDERLSEKVTGDKKFLFCFSLKSSKKFRFRFIFREKSFFSSLELEKVSIFGNNETKLKSCH